MFEAWTGSTDRAVDFVRLSMFACCKTRYFLLFFYCFFIVFSLSSRRACFRYIRLGVIMGFGYGAERWAGYPRPSKTIQYRQHCGGATSRAQIHLLVCESAYV